jgi:hypothetical protein
VAASMDISPIVAECVSELRVIAEQRGDRGRFLDTVAVIHTPR